MKRSMIKEAQRTVLTGLNLTIWKLILYQFNERKIMAGTKEGGMKARATNIAKYGNDYYASIGAKGGRNGHTGGFAANHDLAVTAGRKGGQISKRGKAKREEVSA